MGNALRAIAREVKRRFALSIRGIHGAPHWARVRRNGLVLARETGANVQVVEIFAMVHDSMRVADIGDPDHGHRAVQFLKEIRASLVPLDDSEFELLCYACEHHSHGLLEADITVQTCWDADRLDLGRIGVYPDTDFLCTEAARTPEMIAWAYARSLGERGTHSLFTHGEPFTRGRAPTSRGASVDGTGKACLPTPPFERLDVAESDRTHSLWWAAASSGNVSLQGLDRERWSCFCLLPMEVCQTDTPWLGIEVATHADGRTFGVRVRRTTPGGPAALAGIRGAWDERPASVDSNACWMGHVIVACGGTPVRDEGALRTALSGHRPGDEMTLVVATPGDSQRSSRMLKVGRAPAMGSVVMSEVMRALRTDLHCVYAEMDEMWPIQLMDFITYEASYGRCVAVVVPEAMDLCATLERAAVMRGDPRAPRSTDSRWIVHSTPRHAWDRIRREGKLLCRSQLEHEEGVRLGPDFFGVLRQPPDYRGHVMFGEMGDNAPENIVASKNADKPSLRDGPYEPGVRMYFDAHRIIRDGLAVRDGCHTTMKVLRSLSLDYMVDCIMREDLDSAGQVPVWTKSAFVDAADDAFRRRMKIRTSTVR